LLTILGPSYDKGRRDERRDTDQRRDHSKDKHDSQQGGNKDVTKDSKSYKDE